MLNLNNYYFNFQAIPLFLVAISMLAAGIFVYSRNRASSVNKSFLLICLSVDIWLMATAFGYMSNMPETAKIWFKIDNFGVMFISINVYFFVSSFLEINRRPLILSGYVIALILGITAVSTDLLVKGVRRFFWGYFPQWGYFSICVFFVFFGFMLASFAELCRHYKVTPSSVKKNQIKYIFVAFLGAYTGFIDYLPTFGLEIYPSGYISIAFFLSIIAYSIIKYQLMEIEVIIKKTLVFASLFAVAFGLFVGITLLTQELIGGGRLLGLAISTIIIILAVRPLEDFLIRITDKYLFQKKYDPLELLKTFSDKVLASVLDREGIIEIAVDLLTKALNLETFAVMLVNKEGDKYEISGSLGLEDKSVTFSRNSHLIMYLNKTFGPVIKKSRDKQSIELVQDMDRIKAELCIPLIFHKHLVGILAFGKKKSDQEYTNDDLNILVPLSRDIAIAIVYAKLYEEMRQKDKLATMGTLVAGIKHEIGNPLSGILTSTQVMIKEMETWDSLSVPQKEREEKFKSTLDEVLYESRRIGRITKKFTDFAKPGDEGVKEIVNVEDSLNGALEILQNELNLRHIEIEKNIPRDTPSIFVDKDQAHQIFFNILRNAAQAIEESKKPKEESKITITVEKKVPDKVVIDISDTGLGITEEKKKRIFEPFYTTKQKGKGTGLGLAIVHQLVGRNKGDISFKSREGKGTTFMLEFPIGKNG